MHHPVQQYSRVENPSPDMRRRRVDTPSSSLSKDPPSNASPSNKQLRTVTIMILPLILQAATSIAITSIMLFPLNHSQYFLERHPTVPLADGTPIRIEGYHLLQSDIVTLISVSLVILRWIAAAWAGPLCWRVICLLGESHGVQRRDIRWVSSRRVLPPSTYFRHPLAFVLGVILLVSTVPQAFSPLLTGSITWEPVTLRLDSIPGHSQPTVNIKAESIYPTNDNDVPMRFARNFVTAWGTSNEPYANKRVISSIEGLSINSTIANVTLPYLHTSVEWYQTMPSQMEQQLNMSLYKNGTIDSDTMTLAFEPGSIWLTMDEVSRRDPAWFVIVRIGARSLCPPRWYERWVPGDCFAMARISYNATSGDCINCRVASPFVVQNDTELDLFKPYSRWEDAEVVWQLPKHIPAVKRLLIASSPLQENLTLYVQMALSHAYSALWSTTIDGYNPPERVLTSKYSPPLPALKAHVDSARVFAWLSVQLAATCAGIVFLYLQSRSKHPLIDDTSMVAFDMDTSDAPKPRTHDKSEPAALFMIEPDGDRWKVAVNASLDPTASNAKP